MTSTNGFTPDGHTTVAPWVITDDTGALLDFIAEVFAGEELARVARQRPRPPRDGRNRARSSVQLSAGAQH